MTDRKKPTDPIPPIVSRTKTPPNAPPRKVSEPTETPTAEAPPMAAPKRDFHLMRAWAQDLGLEWNVVLEAAGITNRTTPWRLEQGTASMGVLRKIENVLSESAKQRGASNVAELARAWADAGVELAMLDPEMLETVLGHVRKVLDGARGMKELLTLASPTTNDDSDDR